MKTFGYVLLFFCAGSCTDYSAVQFETAQPADVNPSASFARKVQGTYKHCTETGDELIISEKLVLNKRSFRYKSHRDDLEWEDDRIIDRNNDAEIQTFLEAQGWEVAFIGDTLHFSHETQDTVFLRSEDHVLKEFKKSYFLNYQREDERWNVTRLDLKKDTLILGKISPSDTLLRFDFAVKNEVFDPADSTTTRKYRLTPSKREFRQLMQPNAFDTCACYFKTS